MKQTDNEKNDLNLERKSRRQRRIFAWTYFVLVLAYVGWNKLPIFKSQVIYVSPTGSSWNSGRSKDTPISSINDAVSRVASSGHIYLLPGVYQERVHVRTGGTSEKPLVIEAVDPANTKLTWSRNIPGDINKQWFEYKNENFPDNKIYRISTDWPIYQVRHGGEWLFRARDRLSQLEQLVSMDNAYGAFHYSKGHLFVYLKGGMSPKNEVLEVNAPVPEPREWGEFRSANIWLEADHIELRGLQCEFGIGSSVSLWDTTNVSIVDCSFTGTNIGVNAAHTRSRNNPRLKITRCWYHNYPQFFWRKDWLPWKEIYNVYSSSSLVLAPRGDVVVESCLVSHAGDGMQINNLEPSTTIRVQDNLMIGCTDDAFELDGYGVNIEVTNNCVVNAHQNLGISPVRVGPCVIDGNIFAHPLVRLNGSLVKFLAPDPKHKIKNVKVHNNAFVGNWICYGTKNEIENVSIENNLFWYRAKRDPMWPAGITESENRYKALPEETRIISEKELSEFLVKVSRGKSVVTGMTFPISLQRYGPDWVPLKTKMDLNEGLVSETLVSGSR